MRKKSVTGIKWFPATVTGILGFNQRCRWVDKIDVSFSHNVVKNFIAVILIIVVTFIVIIVKKFVVNIVKNGVKCFLLSLFEIYYYYWKLICFFGFRLHRFLTVTETGWQLAVLLIAVVWFEKTTFWKLFFFWVLRICIILTTFK